MKKRVSNTKQSVPKNKSFLGRDGHSHPTSPSYTLAKQAIKNKEYHIAKKIIKNDTFREHWHQCLKAKILFQTNQHLKALKILKTCINFQRQNCPDCLLLLLSILNLKQINIQDHLSFLTKLLQMSQLPSDLQRNIKGCLKEYNLSDHDDDEDQNPQSCDQLLRVYEERGAKLNKVGIVQIQQGYRVAVAKHTIKPRQLIIFVPENQIITLETAKKNPIVEKIYKEQSKFKSPKHCILSIYLLIEKMRGEDSQYFTYISTLPQNLNSFPVYYSEQLLTEIEGTAFYSLLIRKKMDIQEDYEKISQIIKNDLKFTFDQFLWARMIVCSRIFGIITYGEKTDALVPIADMLNHKIPKMTAWSFSDKLKGFIVENGNSQISKGQQMYDSYGSKCNSRFLLNYGFIQPDNMANETTVSLLRTEYYRISHHTFRVNRMLWSHQFKALIEHFRRQVSIEMNPQSKKYEQQNEKKYQKFLNREIETKVWDYIEIIFNKKLKSYNHNIKHDERQLKKEGLDQNYRNCIEIRLGQKNVLKFYVKMAINMKEYLKKNRFHEKYNIYETYIRSIRDGEIQA